ncbi:MAG: hypothetical protein COB04_12455 [Gammaproteobacteria bacterium]|nr:MAG: hypothetical protein COB04_12455 [Gammaproteobacteria bacterium]
MEACYSSNYWGRHFQELGHTVDLIPPHQIKPFVVGNKNDHNDAIAIAEAPRRPKATFVRVKTLEQQDIQSLDRIPDRLLKSRTAVVNQLRGLLAEYGAILEKTINAVRKEIPAILEDPDNRLTSTAREFVHSLHQELMRTDRQVKSNEEKTNQLLSQNDDYIRLRTIPGIGLIVGRGLIGSIFLRHLIKIGAYLFSLSLPPIQFRFSINTALAYIRLL